MLTMNNHLLVLYLLFLQSIWASCNTVNLNYQVADLRRNPNYSSHQRPFRRKVVGAHRRVIGGSVVPRGSRPYMVKIYLLYRNGKTASFCGGTVISSRHILTAAHCFSNKQVRAFELVLRTYSADPYDYYKTDRTAIKMLLPISNVKIHEKFNYPIPMANDIAIIRMDRSIDFDRSCVGEICVSPVELDGPDNYRHSWAGYSAVGIGWGQTSSYFSSSLSYAVKHVSLFVLTNQECTRQHPGEAAILDSQICASSPGASVCQGDSGGPLLIGDVQIGIVSRGPRMCTSQPSVYTRVSHFRSWIEAVISRR